jgi:hypothetical protein
MSPLSIVASAIRRASAAVAASEPITEFFVQICPLALKDFPSIRLTRARHLLGTRSNALITNCLYSIPDPRRIAGGIRVLDADIKLAKVWCYGGAVFTVGFRARRVV